MILCGDCLQMMKTFPDNHFSAIVTDPPYGLHFMGKDWDHYSKGKVKVGRKVLGAHTNSEAHAAARYDENRNDEFQEFMYQWAIEALRITKPGGHCLMFGAPRRYHRQVCALEDAGWEIRDCLMWMFGSGFPKSHNHFGIDGYGTALKPAYEPIIMAMKPIDGTFKQNAEKWGHAGINIDRCRIPTDEKWKAQCHDIRSNCLMDKKGRLDRISESDDKGRWPANIMFDEEAAAMLDEQSGITKSSNTQRNNRPSENIDMSGANTGHISYGHSDHGGASRFFYCAKTSRSERNEGLDDFEEKPLLWSSGTKNPGSFQSDGTHKVSKNNHPTVKPLALMAYLIKLVMPPKDGLLLDPFAGSGSTIVAAKRLGFKAIGIEKQPEYCEIARSRLESEESKPRQLDLFMGLT